MFNVSLGIIELQVHDPVYDVLSSFLDSYSRLLVHSCPTQTDPTTPWNVDCGTTTLTERLSLFSAWRGNKGNDGVGLWHLMSGCPTGSEVGIAWLATMCQQQAIQSDGSSVSGAAVSTGGRTEWQVIAHETGHNFGAIVRIHMHLLLERSEGLTLLPSTTVAPDVPRLQHAAHKAKTPATRTHSSS